MNAIHFPEGTFNPNAVDPANEDWKREQVFEVPDEDDDSRDDAGEWAGLELPDRY